MIDVLQRLTAFFFVGATVLLFISIVSELFGTARYPTLFIAQVTVFLLADLLFLMMVKHSRSDWL
jgi:hypothetical protein